MISYILIACGVAIITWLCIYLDGRLFDKPKKKMVYFKIISLNVLIVMCTVWILTWLSPSDNIKDVVQSGGSIKIEGPTVELKDIGETMLSGEPNF